jgi:hypothetical protein
VAITRAVGSVSTSAEMISRLGMLPVATLRTATVSQTTPVAGQAGGRARLVVRGHLI